MAHDLKELEETFFLKLDDGKRHEEKGKKSDAVKSYGEALAAVEVALSLKERNARAFAQQERRQMQSKDFDKINLLKEAQRKLFQRRKQLVVELKAEGEKERAARMAPQTASADEHEARGKDSFEKALEFDEKGCSKDALPFYLEAAEQYISVFQVLQEALSREGRNKAPRRNSGATKNSDDGVLGKVADRVSSAKERATLILNRVEKIKVSNAGAMPEAPTGAMTVSQAKFLSKKPPSQLPKPPPPAQQPPARASATAAGGAPVLPTAPTSKANPAAAATAVVPRNLGQLSDDEKEVLKRGSRINGKLFMPWVNDQKSERWSYERPWEDPEGVLALGTKQQAALGNWKRPNEFIKASTGPMMIANVSPYCITQDLVGDCSFVASLCITAAFERRFKRSLITSIIYPQRDGKPVVNPSGKYLVKLWANGCQRRIIVDDRMPCDKEGNLMTCYSNNRRELWVSIIEKAYMKLNGGYDFPGSNSGIDLFALTGWLPESIYLEEDGHIRHQFKGKGDSKDKDASSGSSSELSKIQRKDSLDPAQHIEHTWRRLASAHKFGDCLITIATGELDEEEAERAGLVPTHAYAVLDVREVATGGGSGVPEDTHGSNDAGVVRLLQVKNPWAKKRWKGNYSAQDKINWTPQLKQALNYDPDAASQYDNGVFWIDFKSVRKYFRVVHMNWNPGLFGSNRTVCHYLWPKSQGPPSDSYNYGENPQFSLFVDLESASGAGGTVSDRGRASKESKVVKRSSASPSVWVLLTRHVMEKEADEQPDAHDARGGGGGRGLLQDINLKELADNGLKDFLTIHVYDDTGGKRIFTPTKAMIEGIYSNNPHTLVRFDIPPVSANELPASSNSSVRSVRRSYTLVVSQYKKVRDVSFTLNVYCTAPFRLMRTPATPPHKRTVKGHWGASTCGGCPNNAAFYTNPQWALTVGSGSAIRLHCELSAPKEYHVGLRLVRGSNGRRVDSVPSAKSVNKNPDGSGAVAASDSGSIPSEVEYNPVEEASSGSYRNGCAILECPKLEPGTYTLVASTFDAGQIGPFILTIASSLPLTSLKSVPAEGDGMESKVLKGKFEAGSTAAGCHNHGQYDNNPAYRLIFRQRTRIQSRLNLPPMAVRGGVAAQLALYSSGTSDSNNFMDGRSKNALVESNKGVYTAASCGVALGPIAIEPGSYLLVPSTFDPWVGDFRLAIYTHPAGAQIDQVQ